MEPSVRECGHTAEKQKVCPECKRKGTIVFWKQGPGQMDLAGKISRDLVKLKGSYCSFCRVSFPPGQKFEDIR